MKILRPEIVKEHGMVTYRVAVESLGRVRILWYSVEERFGSLVSDFSDAPIVALLIVAMANGENIYVDGKISERLFYNIRIKFQKVLRDIFPSLNNIEIKSEEILSGTSHGSGVATGFSGGIDSFCVLADHFYRDVTNGFKITHLLFNNVGSHGWGGENLFNERFARLRPLAERMGIPFVKVNSNLDTFYSGTKGFGFQQTHTLRNVSVALLLQNGIKRYMYASTFPYTKTFIGPAYDLAYSDNVTLPLLSTEMIDVFSVGSEYTRVEKTIRVNDVPDSYNLIDVCVEPGNSGKNCSVCWKCMRTLLTLDIAGICDNYSASFDLDAYKERRANYIEEVLQSDDPLLCEIVEFAEKCDKSGTLASHLIALRNGFISNKNTFSALQERVAPSQNNASDSKISNLHKSAQFQKAIKEIFEVLPAGCPFLLVDDQQLITSMGGLKALPFLECNGHYNGAPIDDAHAIHELERMRQKDLSYLIIAWPSFWWLKYYKDWNQYLRSTYTCILENERLVIFDLKT